MSVQALAGGGLVLAGALSVAAWGTWFERKFAGAMHNRPGPTEVGPAGLLQPVADLLKLLRKQEMVPAAADRALFRLAPALGVTLTLGALAVIPFGPGQVVSDLDVGLPFALALASVGVLPVWIAGWASDSKYALLGAMRAVSQSISFEVPMALAALVPAVLAGSLRLGTIVEAQAAGGPFALWPPGPGLGAFVLFYACSLAEANRIPFDIPEAESELVAGVTVEYTGMGFGLLYLAEYLHVLVSSALAACLFWGGWDGPGAGGPWWMAAKTLLLFASVIWVRWSLPRLRSDQFLDLCWRWLLPAGLALLGLAALQVGWGPA